MVEGLKTGLVAKVVKSRLSCNGGDAQHKETTQNLHVAGNLDGRRRNQHRRQHFKKKKKSSKILNLLISNLKRKWVPLPCIETMGANTSGVVPTLSLPIAVAGTISKMLDGSLLGEEPPDVKVLNDGVVLLNGMGGDTMESGTSLHMALSPSPKCAAIKGQPPKARARFDPLVIGPRAVKVVVFDEQDLMLACRDQKLLVQIEGE
ncbi:hypothetical protein AMTR_s00027p00247610 [Amborella trichopoda]|uniref:Uncharacterized protein n=1 Tax=Amborella trichopoda TaxID=13333 RepID=W1PU86_AMBTC|nr:hypothetical protein AMTR_s00027p00247610 [Amborella trichopoda]